MSSCETELQELMHQIDIMVNQKKSEWERQEQALLARLQVREEELANTQFSLDQKHQELGRLRQHVEHIETSQKKMVQNYEEQLDKFKSELSKLGSSYEKSRKYHLKQAKERNRNKSAESEETQIEISRLNQKLEEYRAKSREWDNMRILYQSQLASLEGQRKALAEKCALFQQQSQSYHTQVTSEMKLHEQGRLSSEMETECLRSQLQASQEALQSNEATIGKLTVTIEDMTTVISQLQREKQLLLQELNTSQRKSKTMELEQSELRIELQSRDDLLKVTELEHTELRNEIAKMKEANTKQESAFRLQEQGSQKMITRELGNLKLELESSLWQLKESRRNEKVLKAEISRLQAGLESLQSHCMQLNEELTKKKLEWQSEQKQTEQQTEINKLRERLLQVEKSHSSEMEGMRIEVSDLTTELHKKDFTIATVREKIKHIERQHKVELEKRNRQLIEHQVTRSELEALREENGHLKKLLGYTENKNMTGGSVHQVLQESFAASIGKLEYEKKKLQNELVNLRTELETSSQASQEKYEAALRHTDQVITKMKGHKDREISQLSEENRWKIKNLQAKLKGTVKFYKNKIQMLQSQNKYNHICFSDPLCNNFAQDHEWKEAEEIPSLASLQVMTHYMDTEQLSEQYLVNSMSGSSVSSIGNERNVVPVSPLQKSFTISPVQQFFQEEEKRAQQLEQVLDSHIYELQKHLDKTVNKHVRVISRSSFPGASSSSSSLKSTSS